MTLVLAIVGRWMYAQPAQTSVASISGSIEGRVFGKDGAPAADLRVAAIAVSEKASSKPGEALAALTGVATTGADGRYVLRDIPVGRYFIVAGPLRDLVYLAQVTIAPASRLNAGDSRISAPLAYSIRGRVVRDRNMAGESIVLEGGDDVLGPSGPNWTTLITPIAADGSFEFPGVRPGAYSAHLIPDMALPEMNLSVHGDLADVAIPIPLHAVKDIRVKFVTVVEGGGLAPRVRLPLALSRAAEPDRPLPAWYNGTIDIQSLEFSERLPLGEYRVPTASIPLPAGYSLKSIRSGATDLRKDPLTITAMGAPPIEITLTVSSPPPWRRVEGRVTGLDKLKVPPNRILIATSELASTLVSEIGPDGRFDFPAALPGVYHVVLSPAPDTVPRTLTVGSDPVTHIELSALPAQDNAAAR
jgi:hypothetical protein